MINFIIGLFIGIIVTYIICKLRDLDKTMSSFAGKHWLYDCIKEKLSK